MSEICWRKTRVSTFEVLPQRPKVDLSFRSAIRKQRYRVDHEFGPTFDHCGLRLLRFHLRYASVWLLHFGRTFGPPFKKLVARVAQCIWRLWLANNADHCSSLSKLPAEICEIGVARYEAELVCAVIEHSFQGVQCQRDVGCILTCRVLILQTRCKSQANQSLLPSLGKCAVVAIATTNYNTAELSNHTECVLQYLRAGVVAIY